MAIAFDAITETSGTSISVSHTTSGSDRFLVVHAWHLDMSNVDQISGITYNSVSLTRKYMNRFTGSGTSARGYIYTLPAPASGSNTLAVTITTAPETMYFRILSYTGCDQSSTGGATGGSRATGNPSTGTITTTFTDAWVTGAGGCIDGSLTLTAATGTKRGSATQNMIALDSNATVSPGSNSLAINSSFAGEAKDVFLIEILPPQPTVYDETYTETLTLVDSLTRSIERTFSDVMTLVDTANRSIERTFDDVITLVDTVVTEKIIPVVLEEVITLTDTIQRSIDAVRTEVMTLVDTANRSVERTLSDVMTLVDTFARVLTLNVVLTETITLTDIIRKVLNGSSTIWTKTTKAVAATWTKITKAGQ